MKLVGKSVNCNDPVLFSALLLLVCTDVSCINITSDDEDYSDSSGADRGELLSRILFE